MNFEDIVALARAGFTAAQIAAMANTNNQPVVQPVNQPVVQPVNQPVVQPINQPVVQPVNQPVVQPAYNDTILEQLRMLTASVQNGNIMNTNQPTPRNADDVLASIINPPANRDN